MIWVVIYLIGVIATIAIMIFDDPHKNTLPEDVMLLSAVWPILALLGLLTWVTWAWEVVQRWRTKR